jgi:hypothetical protein
MSVKEISKHTSDDGQRTALVLARGDAYRVTCFDSYFETSMEYFCDRLQEAEDKAEDWVLRA